MKKWRCSVCGYIHEGSEPPERCPMCGAPREKFYLLTDGDTAASAAIPAGGTLPEGVWADVLVVGSGAAAFSAAITAKAHGASVIILEKAASAGGTTIRSGGGYWVPNNRFQRKAGVEDNKEDALRYMARYSYPQLFNPDDPRLGLPENEYNLLEAYCDKADEMSEFHEKNGSLFSIMDIGWTGQPSVDYQETLPENKGIRGRTLFPMDPTGKPSYGFEMIRQFETWCSEHGVPILLNHRVTRILQNSKKEVCGLEVDAGGPEKKVFRARKAVIFGSGGYSHNPEMMLHYQRGPHFGGCSAPSNTGDFINMGIEVGAKLGNLAGAFRAQSLFEKVLFDPGASNNVFYIPGDSVLEVNKHGQRFVDEKINYTDRTMLHFVWDPLAAEWTNMLTFLVYDKRTAALWQGYPPYPLQNEQPSYVITGDTLDDLAAEIKKRLGSHAAHTGGFSLAPDYAENLKATVRRFNQFASSGKDEDFHRGERAYDREWTTFPPTIPGQEWPPPDSPNYTMYPLSDEGPYFAMILAAGTLDTNGGPVINHKAQVVNVRGSVIPGLYGAGNCIAAPTANAYWGGGSTIGPALTFGYIAALNALEETDKTEEL